MLQFAQLSKFSHFRYAYITAAAILVLSLSACRTNDPAGSDQAELDAARDSVRAMASAIARDITNDGPNAWLKYFERSPHFYMASDGKLAFDAYDSAAAFVPIYAKGVCSITLTWGDMKIEPLTPSLATMRSPFHEAITDTSGHQLPSDGYFTALAEHSSSGWQLRNLHWSIVH